MVLRCQSGKEVHSDVLFWANGRSGNTENMGLEDIGVAINQRGQIEVDGQSRTTADGVWAIGDCVRGPMLAHKGSEEGVMVADLIAGEFSEVNYDLIPSIIYTAPEIAWVGKTEEKLKEAGTRYKVGTFSFAARMSIPARTSRPFVLFSRAISDSPSASSTWRTGIDEGSSASACTALKKASSPLPSPAWSSPSRLETRPESRARVSYCELELVVLRRRSVTNSSKTRSMLST